MNQLDDLFNAVYSTTVTDISVLVREVRVRIGVLTQPVTVWIFYAGKGDNPYRFETSALMKTSRFDARNAPRDAPTEIEALRRAVRMLTRDYEAAVRDGEIPDDRWLVGTPGDEA